MDSRKFLDNFEHIVSAPNGINQIRELILQLAVQGRLVEQDRGEEQASIIVEEIETKKANLLHQKKIRRPQKLQAIRDHEKPFSIPNSWIWVRLGDIVQFEAGRTPARKESIYWDNRKYPWISIADMVDGGYISSTKESISEKAFYNVFKGRIVPKGTLLMSFKLSIGKLSILNIDALHNEAIISIYPYLESLKPYLFKCINGFDILRGKSAAIKGNTLNRSSIENIVLAIPPIGEQKRILVALDKAQKLCDQLEDQQAQLAKTCQMANQAAQSKLTDAITISEVKDAWSRVSKEFNLLLSSPESVTEFTETIMDLAVRGKLTEKKSTDEHAALLLKNIHPERKSYGKNPKRSKTIESLEKDKYTLPAGWEICRANDLALFITSGSRGWAEYYSNEGAWFIRIGNLSYQTTQLKTINMQYVLPPKGSEGTRTRVESSDILISITGDTGMVGVVPSDVPEAYINQHICLFRPTTLINHEYLALMFRSRSGLRQLQKLQKGIKNSLSLQDIRDVIIYLPPREEQTRIVNITKRLLTLADQAWALLFKLDDIHEKLAFAATQTITKKQPDIRISAYETIAIKDTAEAKVIRKLPSVLIKLVKTMKKKIEDTVLAKLLMENGKSLEAKDLWQKSGLPIDEFYATLKNEIKEGFIAEPYVATLKLVEVGD